MKEIQSEPHDAGAAANLTYAEVAVPLHVFLTFTYRLNGTMGAQATPGARITVPLGRKLVTGYIVALYDELPASLAGVEQIVGFLLPQRNRT